MLVAEFLEESARRFPEKTALITERERFTYREIEERASALADAMAAAGVSRGDRVVIVLPNSVEAVVAIFAALKADAVFVVLHATMKSEKLAYVLNNCRATAIVVDSAKFETEPQWLGETPYLRSVFVRGGDKEASEAICRAGKRYGSLESLRWTGGARAERRSIDIDLAALIYTSGSTGRPKGVMMTHLNIVSAANSITTYLENRADDVVLNVLPLSFDYGLYQLLMMFKVGGTLVLLNSFAYAHPVLQRIAEEGVTGFPIVPTISATLLQMNLSRYAFPKLRYITNTAAALPIEHIRKLRALFPQVKIYSMYGLTECKRVSYLPPEEIDVRPGSVGRGMPNEEVYIVDPEGNRVGPGAVGELVIRGSNVMKGYWELPEETERCLRPGPLPGERVLHSGDLFYADQDGYLYFVGRRDDIIKTRGEKVSPREIEDAIYSLDSIAEAAVIAIPDPILGSAIKALVVAKPGTSVTAQQVLRHCATKLEDFMVPKVVEVRASLPRTESGKVNRRMLAEEESEMRTESLFNSTARVM
ncbi:AMP-binding protein [Occallatibacter savannae]|uniref:AMP-binding protein n=1 Tax=Occallatibacter savannae TaxID=1002691 RepID=UPI000D694756|nr:AMP-binding protein [Occallatibacter savannae]